MAGYDSLHQLIVASPWICKGPLLWTDKHLELLGIKFQPTGPLVPFPSICRSICDPSAAYGKEFVAGLTSEAKRAAFVRIFQSLSYGYVHLTWANTLPSSLVSFVLTFPVFSEEKAIFMYDGKKIHTTSCWISQPLPPVLYEYPIIGYFHYDDVKWDRLESIQPKDNPGARIGGNAPVARLCRRRLQNATPQEWYKDPYLVGLILSLAR